MEPTLEAKVAVGNRKVWDYDANSTMRNCLFHMHLSTQSHGKKLVLLPMQSSKISNQLLSSSSIRRLRGPCLVPQNHVAEARENAARPWLCGISLHLYI